MFLSRLLSPKITAHFLIKNESIRNIKIPTTIVSNFFFCRMCDTACINKGTTISNVKVNTTPISNFSFVECLYKGKSCINKMKRKSFGKKAKNLKFQNEKLDFVDSCSNGFVNFYS